MKFALLFLVPAVALAEEPVPTKSEDMTAASMEAALTDLMLGKTQFGATPMGGSVKQIEDILEKTMMPAVKAAHNADQGNTNRLGAALGLCSSTMEKNRKGATPAFVDYTKTSSLHKKCRDSQAVMDTSSASCLEKQRGLYNEKILKCKAYAEDTTKYATQKANNDMMKKAGSETDEGYIQRISSTMCGTHNHGTSGSKVEKGGWGGGLPDGVLDKYLKSKGSCESSKGKWGDKVKECKQKHSDFLKQRSICNSFQKAMDNQACKHAVMLKDTCEGYLGCYNSVLAEFLKVSGDAKSAGEDRKQEWRGLKRMACIIKAFADGKVTNAEVEVCKKSTVNTDFLTVTIPTIPPPKKCALPSLYPSTDSYLKANFAPLPTLAKGIESSPCAGMMTVSTTPSGTVKGAKCERLALTGHYRAGALLKCTNGHDVYKSNDRNSCPQGTKIFAPASRQDWKTFLASAGPLRAPHWIVDITRPQNGCAGCTSHAMNWKNVHQKSWRTSDGSPWWLRSTKYSQPDGDYTANCYLDLWRTPTDENSITLNDNSCNIHSKSYYCQPINLKLKPKNGPASCKCSQVPLSGIYSAGQLVKCEHCTVVYKSTQANSCPKGMKIFSPQSRNDWKVILNSAVPLRAPHWIIDVTRPQNGCGGCAKFAMKSSTPQQATWKTSDGSPWWLRSTSFREPSGDYTANCFMNLANNFKSSDTVQFNDGSCSYHSKSYFCQPKNNDQRYGGPDKKIKELPPPPAPKIKELPALKPKLVKKTAKCFKAGTHTLKNEGTTVEECAKLTAAKGYKNFYHGNLRIQGRCNAAIKGRKAKCTDSKWFDSYELV